MNRRARPHHAHLRTCVGCRRRASVSELLRVVAIASVTDSGTAQFSLRPDFRRALPGRGAHLHPEPGCLALALRRHAFGRALRVTGVIDTGELSETIASLTAGELKTIGGASAPPKE